MNNTFGNGYIYQIWLDNGELRSKQLKSMGDLNNHGAIVKIEIVEGQVHFISFDNLPAKKLMNEIDRSLFLL